MLLIRLLSLAVMVCGVKLSHPAADISGLHVMQDDFFLKCLIFHMTFGILDGTLLA